VWGGGARGGGVLFLPASRAPSACADPRRISTPAPEAFWLSAFRMGQRKGKEAHLMLHLAKNHTDHHAEGVYIDGRPRAGVGLGPHLGWAVLSSAYSAREPASAQRTADTYVRGLRSDRAAAGARGCGWVGGDFAGCSRTWEGAYHGAGSSCRLQASPKSMSTVRGSSHVQSCIRTYVVLPTNPTTNR